jgi:hypothetical protein
MLCCRNLHYISALCIKNAKLNSVRIEYFVRCGLSAVNFFVKNSKITPIYIIRYKKRVVVLPYKFFGFNSSKVLSR